MVEVVAAVEGVDDDATGGGEVGSGGGDDGKGGAVSLLSSRW